MDVLYMKVVDGAVSVVTEQIPFIEKRRYVNNEVEVVVLGDDGEEIVTKQIQKQVERHEVFEEGFETCPIGTVVGSKVIRDGKSIKFEKTEEMIKAEKASLIKRIIETSETVRSIATGYAPQGLINAWNAKAPCARAIIAGTAEKDSVEYEVIALEAAGKSYSTEALAEEIVNNANQLAKLNGPLENFTNYLQTLVEFGKVELITNLLNQADQSLPDQTRETIGPWLMAANEQVEKALAAAAK